ncbi:MAG: ACT domain-containing protein [Candidatus Sumerlaeia bacterium]
MEIQTTAGYRVTVRCEIQRHPGNLGKILTVIGEEGGLMGAIDLVEAARDHTVRDITFQGRNEEHIQQILQAIRRLPIVKIRSWSDHVFLRHLGGKIEIHNKLPLNTRDSLSIAYTPGVARVCQAIAEDPQRVYNLTIKKNTVAIVTDGTAVLGLGDIGPEAAMPVMEGKAMLFKEFANIDAWPICLATKDPDEIVRTVELIAPGFGGVNLEDISAPRCFEIEERLKRSLNIPVFHDDQHGTAVVVMAALINSLKIVGKKPKNLKVVILGVGAAGVACAKIMMAFGVRNIIGVDRAGTVYKGRREHMNESKKWFAAHTNPERVKGDIVKASRGADVFLGLSGPGLFPMEALRAMAKDPIVFALANPTPEIMPEEAAPYARIIATGRSDYPNQINNVLAFPGIFRGALNAGATQINEEMKKAAAEAIAQIVGPDELDEDFIIPSVFNRRVVREVSHAVAAAAVKTGVTRKQKEVRD